MYPHACLAAFFVSLMTVRNECLMRLSREKTSRSLWERVLDHASVQLTRFSLVLSRKNQRLQYTDQDIHTHHKKGADLEPAHKRIYFSCETLQPEKVEIVNHESMFLNQAVGDTCSV